MSIFMIHFKGVEFVVGQKVLKPSLRPSLGTLSSCKPSFRKCLPTPRLHGDAADVSSWTRDPSPVTPVEGVTYH